MNINSETKLFGILGTPIKHSLSPKLHNTLYQKLNINAAYLAYDIKPEHLVDALEAVRSLGMSGVNVTLPHKEGAAIHVDAIPNPIDRGIGAVNTIVNKEGQLLGYNTDGPGFISDLKDSLNLSPKDLRVLMVGAGGAARAVAFYLLKCECKELYIYNRTPDRARGLAEYLKKNLSSSRVDSILLTDELKGKPIDLLVNTSSCGMNAADPFPINPDILSQVKNIYDLIYGPVMTSLVREARKRKIKAVNGHGMLIHQALLAELIWFPNFDRTKSLKLLREAYEACCT